MVPRTWSGRSVSPEPLHTFLLRQILHSPFWMLYLTTLAIYLLYGWRGYLRNMIWRDIR
jgi:hypothetical protein